MKHFFIFPLILCKCNISFNRKPRCCQQFSTLTHAHVNLPGVSFILNYENLHQTFDTAAAASTTWASRHKSWLFTPLLLENHCFCSLTLTLISSFFSHSHSQTWNGMDNGGWKKRPFHACFLVWYLARFWPPEKTMSLLV